MTTTQTKAPPTVRWMILRDMPYVLTIEADSFEFPWDEAAFIRCLRQRNCIGMVAADGDRVLGYMIYELQKSWLRVLNFAVRVDFRRTGVGRAMLDKLKGKLTRRKRITLEVRETNLSAQLFFQRCGFRATAVLRGFYDDTPEDAYVMEFREKECWGR